MIAEQVESELIKPVVVTFEIDEAVQVSTE